MQTQYIQSTTFYWRYQEESIVVWDFIRNKGYAFAESARILWEQLTEPRTKDYLVDFFLNNYEVTKDLALADIDEFLENLINARLVSIYKKPSTYIP